MTGVQTCALPICFPVTIGGGNETERVHIHGVIFTDLNNDTILKSWKFGIADDGRSTGRKGWVNEQTINYITKYVFKTDSKHIDFKGRIFASAGIGKAYIQNELNRYRHRYQGEKQIQLIQIVKDILVDYRNTTEIDYTQKKKGGNFGVYN